MTNKRNYGILSLPVIVGALGYFVDIYDLLLFTIVREPSLKDIGVNLLDAKAAIAASTKIINWQMVLTCEFVKFVTGKAASVKTRQGNAILC